MAPNHALSKKVLIIRWVKATTRHDDIRAKSQRHRTASLLRQLQLLRDSHNIERAGGLRGSASVSLQQTTPLHDLYICYIGRLVRAEQVSLEVQALLVWESTRSAFVSLYIFVAH